MPSGTPPRQDVQSDLRPPERPFARQATGTSPSRSLGGFASQASLVPTDSSMLDMHLGMDPPGVHEGPGAQAPEAAAASAPNTPGRTDTVATLKEPAKPPAQSGATFDSESEPEEPTASKPKPHQSFKGFFRKMVTGGKPTPQSTPDSPGETRSRHRKTRSGETKTTDELDPVLGDADESSRSNFWRKLGKSPRSSSSHTRRFVSGTRPPMPGQARDRSSSGLTRAQRTHQANELMQPDANWLFE